MENRNIYDGYLDWKCWGDSFGILDSCTRRYYDLELKKIEKDFRSQNIRVLEIGFGNGGFLTYALERGWDIEGTEINDNLLTIAKNKGFKVYDSIDYLENNVFDLIVAFDVLEHIHPDEIIGFIARVKNKIKKGGFFIARFPNGDSPIGMRSQNGDITHQNMIGVEKIFQISKICNFNVCFLSGSVELVVMETLKKTIHKICVYPIKKIINILFKFIYFPTSPSFFSSENLVVFFKKVNEDE